MMMENGVQLLITFFILLLNVSLNGCSGTSGTISCFVCSSRNGSYTECEDPFNAGVSTYIERCMVPKRGHIGEFPAHFCIKIIGTSYTTNEKIVIRRCTSETMDKQCGQFRFEDNLLRGCILTCDLDGCNSSNLLDNSPSLILSCAIATLLFCFISNISLLTSPKLLASTSLKYKMLALEDQSKDEGIIQLKSDRFTNDVTK